MRQIAFFTIFLFALAISGYTQNERKFVRQGNKYYGAAIKDTTRLDTVQFNKAEIEYRKAIDKKPDDPKWNFNLANSLYKQMKFEEAADKFNETAERLTDNADKGRALHNLGNALLMNNKLDESIEAYKKALRNNPDDLETKYNLLYAMNLKKKQEQEQKKNQDKNKDQDKDKNKDQDQNKDQQQQDQQQQPQNKISKQNAEQMLQALENSEKKTQEKVKKEKALRLQSKQVEKDW